MANSQRYSYAPETIIKAYALGVFPMADSHESREIHFYDPDQRALIPLDRHIGTGPHIPRRLQRRVRQTPFRVTINVDFAGVISACAAPGPKRADTWINQDIKQLYIALHKMGFAHSIEVWDDAVLVGGLYGVALRAAFFGESMFSRKTDASKIALVHLMARLQAGRLHFLDAQFSNDHLRQFGVTEVPRHEFQSRLAAALAADADLHLLKSSQRLATAFLEAVNAGKV